MQRQCGSRKKGGVYLTVATGPDGKPIEDFIFCPPIPIDDLSRFGIGPRGVYLIERAGGFHVADVIGQEYYPNVADFIVEGDMMNISRRAEGLDYSKLTRRSRLIVIHQRAHIENYADIIAEMGEAERKAFRCFKGQHEHKIDSLDEMCTGLWWHNVEEMENKEEIGGNGELPRLKGLRKLKCWTNYHGHTSQTIKPVHQYAFFASFPLGGIEVIEDPDDGTHEAKLERAQKSGLDVNLVKE
jgi:hypothetical protein